MSSITSPSRFIPKPIANRVSQLRSRIRTWLTIDGLSKVFAALVILVLLDAAIDRMFRLDIAQRIIMLVLISVAVIGVFWWRLLKPFFYRPSDDSLILEFEAQDRNLQESIISSAQLSRVQNPDSLGVSSELMNATIEQGSQRAETLDVGQVMNQSRMGINLAILAASIMALTAIGIGVSQTEFWKTWFYRNVLLTDHQWPQDTVLDVKGVNKGVLVAPRGEDLQLTVEVLEESSVTDIDVYIEREDGDNRTREKMARTGELDGREHQLIFYDVMNDFRFRAKANRDSTAWIQVRLIDPPIVEKLSLAVVLPTYTGNSDLQPLEGGGPFGVFAGSSLIVKGKLNKPVSSASLRYDQKSWPLNLDDELDFEIRIVPEELTAGKYTFDLVDDSGFQSSRPASFTINIKKDKAPKVRANIVGISSIVTPKASLPIGFSAEDEFAITKMFFEHQFGDESSGIELKNGTTDITEVQGLGEPEASGGQVLDLRPLEIPIGVGLRMYVAAVDNNTMTGPLTGRSQEFLFRVVSEGELRADLLRREIEQRKAFERALNQEQDLITELRVLQASLQEKPAPGDQATQDLRSELLLKFHQRQKVIRTNVARVQSRFEEFLEEAINNRLDESEEKLEDDKKVDTEGGRIQKRLAEKIIQPLAELDRHDGLMEKSSQWIENSRRALSDNDLLNNRLEITIQTQDRLLKRMRAILADMVDSEDYQEIVNGFIKVKKMQEDVKKLNDKERQDSANKDIFDDEEDDTEQSKDDNKNDGDEDVFDK